MPILEPYIAADDVWVLPSYLPVPDVPAPGLGSLGTNSYLIKSAVPGLPDQALLDSILSQLQGGEGHH